MFVCLLVCFCFCFFPLFFISFFLPISLSLSIFFFSFIYHIFLQFFLFHLLEKNYAYVAQLHEACSNYVEAFRNYVCAQDTCNAARTALKLARLLLSKTMVVSPAKGKGHSTDVYIFSKFDKEKHPLLTEVVSIVESYIASGEKKDIVSRSLFQIELALLRNTCAVSLGDFSNFCKEAEQLETSGLRWKLLAFRNVLSKIKKKGSKHPWTLLSEAFWNIKKSLDEATLCLMAFSKNPSIAHIKENKNEYFVLMQVLEVFEVR